MSKRSPTKRSQRIAALKQVVIKKLVLLPEPTVPSEEPHPEPTPPTETIHPKPFITTSTSHQKSELNNKRRRLIVQNDEQKQRYSNIDDIPLFIPDEKLNSAQNVKMMEQKMADELAKNLKIMSEEKAKNLANKRMEEIRQYENLMFQESLWLSAITEREDPEVVEDSRQNCINYLNKKTPYKIKSYKNWSLNQLKKGN
jgi:hypothetical protein